MLDFAKITKDDLTFLGEDGLTVTQSPGHVFIYANYGEGHFGEPNTGSTHIYKNGYIYMSEMRYDHVIIISSYIEKWGA